jgi:AcrR family transcriptional regulator
MSNKRKYDSELRASRAENTRLRIQKAARKLIAASGFDGATVNAIADEAGVSPQTIYAVFGSKAAIVASLLEHLEEEAGEAETVEELMAEPDPRLQLQIFAEWIRRLFDMSADVFSVAVQSSGEPMLAEIRSNGDSRRLGGCKMLTGAWVEAGVLADGSDADGAAEQLWLLTSFETYLLCTSGLGWDSDRYEQWVVESASALVFG